MHAHTIRVRRTEDRADLDGVVAACFPGDRYDLLADADQLWGAHAADEAVGVLAMRQLDAAAVLDLVGVVPAVQGRGLAKRLIRTGLRWARERGLSYVVTYCARWNHASANALIGCGFRLYEPAYKWGFADGLYLWRPLTARHARRARLAP